MSRLRRAAVLVPLYADGSGELRLVLIRRTDRGRHAGQVALPGGNVEPGDPDLRHTAVRETCEELGLSAAQIEVIDRLPDARTATTDYLVAPFVARLHGIGDPPVWRPQETEVAEVLDVGVTELADPAARGERLVDSTHWGGPRPVPSLDVRGHVMWGLTLRILDPVLPRLLAGEWATTGGSGAGPMGQ